MDVQRKTTRVNAMSKTDDHLVGESLPEGFGDFSGMYCRLLHTV